MSTGVHDPVLAPMHLDAERAVIGTALYDAEAALLVARDLEPLDFYDLQLQPIHRSIRDHVAAGCPVSLVSVHAQLAERGEYEAVGGFSKLSVLTDEQTAPENMPRYIALIREAADKRRLMEIGRALTHEGGNGSRPVETMARVDSAFAEIRARDAKGRTDEAPSELNALLAHRFPPRADVVGRGLVTREGLTVIGGRPKLGKSLMIGNLCLQRGRGRPWLSIATDPGVSLIVQSELGARAVQERLATMLRYDPERVPDGRLHIKSRRGVMLDEPAGLAQIAAWIQETGADLVVIDPLARHMVGDENSRDMGAVVRAIDSLIERFKVAVIVAHHPSKPKEGDQRSGGDRLRGHSALFGAADAVWMMDKTDDGFLLTFELRHDATPEPMRLTRTEDLWLVEAGPDPEMVALANLVAASSLSYSALTTAAVNGLDLSKATAKRRIAAALATGVLAKDPDGLYRAGSRSHEVSPDA